MNNTDIYQISGRIKNILASADIALSPAGTVLINTYALMLKDVYDFADTLSEPQKTALNHLLGTKEGLPKYVIQLTQPPKNETLGEECLKAEVKFGSAELALAHFKQEYNQLGDDYGVSGDELWVRAQNAPILNDDCRKIMRLRQAIDLCGHLVKNGRSEAEIHENSLLIEQED
jgi:hypothetical protein